MVTGKVFQFKENAHKSKRIKIQAADAQYLRSESLGLTQGHTHHSTKIKRFQSLPTSESDSKRCLLALIKRLKLRCPAVQLSSYIFWPA